MHIKSEEREFIVSSTLLRRSASSLVVAALVAAGVGLVSTPAGAATVGTLTVSPATGSGLSITTFTSAAQCTAGNTLVLKVYGGPGSGAGSIAAPGVNLNGNTTASNYNSGSGMVIQASQTWSDFASVNSVSTLTGTYSVSANCSSGDSYVGQIRFTAGATVADATYVGVVPTTTAVSSIANSTYGTSKSFTATVTAGVTSASPSGTVQFKDGGSNIGSPQTVGSISGGVGTATLTGQDLGTATHTITAVYTPDSAADTAGVATSTSSGVQYTVSQQAPSLAVTAGTNPVPQGGSTLLTATITDGGAGTVDFEYKIGAGSYQSLATGRTVTAGAATYTWNPSFTQTAGADYTIRATYSPTDTTNYASAVNTLTPFEVSAKSSYNNSETIQVNVPTGALATTMSANTVVVLNTPTISTDGSHFIATGVLNGIKVQDTRAGDFGWVASVVATNFVACSSYSSSDKWFNGTESGGATVGNGTAPACTSPNALAAASAGYQQTTINAYNLGILPSALPDTANSLTLNTGVVAASAIQGANVLPGATGSGLGVSRTIVTATGGTGTGSATGTAIVGGALTLNVPTVNVAGSYASTLTVTVL